MSHRDFVVSGAGHVSRRFQIRTSRSVLALFFGVSLFVRKARYEVGTRLRVVIYSISSSQFFVGLACRGYNAISAVRRLFFISLRFYLVVAKGRLIGSRVFSLSRSKGCRDLVGFGWGVIFYGMGTSLVVRFSKGSLTSLTWDFTQGCRLAIEVVFLGKRFTSESAVSIREGCLRAIVFSLGGLANRGLVILVCDGEGGDLTSRFFRYMLESHRQFVLLSRQWVDGVFS